MAVAAGWLGVGLRTVKVQLLVVGAQVVDPPPGPGFVTTTGNVPVFARSVAVRLMVNRPASFGVMTWWDDPAKVTVEFDMKLLPRIERVIGADPDTTAAEGVRLVTCGCGLEPFPEATVKVAVDVPPPGVGFRTTTEKVPACARSEDVRLNVSVPLST
jgi:hypothetical protein